MVQHRQLRGMPETFGATVRALVAQGQPGPFQHHLGQLPFADGFGQVIIHAALQQGAFFVGHRMGRQRDDGQRCAMAFAFPRADCLGALATVHPRHLHVHQHQVEGFLLHCLDGRVTAFHRLDLGAHVFQQGLHQQQVGRVVVDTQHPRRAAGQGLAGFAAQRARADQVGQGATQFAGARGLGLQLAVGVGHRGVEQQLFGGRAQHQYLAAQVFEVPQVLVQTLRRNVIGGDAQHGQVNRLFGLVGAGDAVGQAFQAVERGDFQAAVFQLMLQGLARQLVVFQHRHAPAQQRRGGQVFDIVTGFRQVQADPEFRAFSRRAVDADLTAHLFDQALGNHQAKAGPAGLA
eukprot:gene21381-biopygen12004